MLIEDVRMCESLRRIVNGFTGDPTLQQDMLQECLVCLWKIESEKPGRTRSWYLQNCRFHVQHWLAAGRSLDSHKRAHGGNRVALNDTEEEEALNGYHTNGELFEAVSVRDLVSTLAPLLKPLERTVLRGLAEGLVLREIALKSGLSYPTALKYRRRIAALAFRLGLGLPQRDTLSNSALFILGPEPNSQFGLKPVAAGHERILPIPATKVLQRDSCRAKAPRPQLKQRERTPKPNLHSKPNGQKLGTQSKPGALVNGGRRRMAA
jgi:DNA-binding CsgD family transcriptional regulator